MSGVLIVEQFIFMFHIVYNLEHKFKTPDALKDTMRQCIIAPKGHKVFSADFSLIEFRILMYVCGHFNRVCGKDIYIEFAKKMFNGKFDKNSKERKLAKVCVLGLGYGLQPKGLWVKLQEVEPKIPLSLAHKGYDTYHRMFPNVKKFHAWVGKGLATAIQEGRLVLSFKLPTQNNRVLNLPLVFKSEGKYKQLSIYPDGVAGKYIQSMARELIFLKQNELMKNNIFCLFNMYDETVGYCREGQVETIKTIMNKPVDWLPENLVQADVSLADNYGEV